jgi:hypothetical protein
MTKRPSQSGRAVRENCSAELEQIINELAADQAAVRIVLQSFVLKLLVVRAEVAPMAVAELHDHVFRSIEAIPVAHDDAIGGARWKRLVVVSAEKLLGEITDTLSRSLNAAAQTN